MKIIVFTILTVFFSVIFANADTKELELITDYTLLIGDKERSYTKEVKGYDIISKVIEKLPLSDGVPNYITLAKGEKDNYEYTEEVILLHPSGVDSDEDGLDNEFEIQLGTNSEKADTDDDGIDDGAEWLVWGKNSMEDFDGDKIPNIIDFDSYSSDMSDGENSQIDISKKVAVINDKNKKGNILEILKHNIPEAISKIEMENYLSFSWESNPENLDCWLHYKDDVMDAEYKGTKLKIGPSPIHIGYTHEYTLSRLDPEKIYYFALTGTTNGLSTPLFLFTAVCVRIQHVYPNETKKESRWTAMEWRSREIKSKTLDEFELVETLIDGESQGVLESVTQVFSKPGSEIVFRYKLANENDKAEN